MSTKTKIAIVVRDDLASWQRLNVTAFLASGIAATVAGVVGEPYVDANDRAYLPMFVQPVLVYAADAAGLRVAHQTALDRELAMAIYPEELFATSNDVDNRAAVRAVETEKLSLVGLAVHGGRNAVDKALKGLALHP